MLFDLRGRGRRNTVKVIYVFLALLMGGGLVLFGIGGSTNGGLVDAITGSSSGGSSVEKRFKQQEAAAQRRVTANPQDQGAYIDLIRARVHLAGTGDNYNPNTDTYTAAGKAQLRQAVAAWTRYQALNPKPSDAQARVAAQMVQAFVSLNDFGGAADAQEVVASSRNSSGTYAQLAVLAYQAGQTRKGDLASTKAVSLADKSERASLKSQLQQAKTQAAASSVQQSSSSSG
jgi:hypothetical protein